MAGSANPACDRRPLPVRLIAKTETNDEGCWLWKAATTSGGYGRIQSDGKARLAHRVSYELFVGEIPEGLHLDHLCRNRGCVNPTHLEPVTPRENLERGVGTLGRRLLERDACRRGHPYDEKNTYRSKDGARHCRACHAASEKRRRIAAHVGRFS